MHTIHAHGGVWIETTKRKAVTNRLLHSVTMRRALQSSANCLANKYNKALHPGRSFCACIQIKIILKNPLDK